MQLLVAKLPPLTKYPKSHTDDGENLVNAIMKLKRDSQ